MAQLLTMNSPDDPLRPLLQTWTGIVSSSSKTSSLKFALARALLDVAQSSETAGPLYVSKEELADLFLRYFWFQTLLFRLRQSAAPITAPLVLTRLSALKIKPRQASEGPNTPAFTQREEIREDLVKNGFNYVLPCFHNLRGGRGSVCRFYERTRNGISVPADVLGFLKREAPLLRGHLYFHWAKWLEAYNSAPRIASKLAFEGERRRGYLRRIGQSLVQWQPDCFYCMTPLAGTFEVDHVIPWAYLFQDPLWDLVLACPKCNRDKSDTLPSRTFMGKLIARNEAFIQESHTLHPVLLQSYHSLPGYPDAAMSRAILQLYESARADGF